jgi:hypothetical protein
MNRFSDAAALPPSNQAIGPFTKHTMPSLISNLTEVEQQNLLEDLNYLNIGEIKGFCKRHCIPYSIWIETTNGDYKKTSDDDRKGVILERIRHYLRTGKILGPTSFPASVVCLDSPAIGIKASDRLRYGQYDKNGDAMVGLLRKLTNGQFENGAVARILARDFWSRGVAPTYQEYAAAWMVAREDHKRPNPEWAFLSDRADRKDTTSWKQLREEKAKQVLKILDHL